MCVCVCVCSICWAPTASGRFQWRRPRIGKPIKKHHNSHQADEINDVNELHFYRRLQLMNEITVGLAVDRFRKPKKKGTNVHSSPAGGADSDADAGPAHFWRRFLLHFFLLFVSFSFPSRREKTCRVFLATTQLVVVDFTGFASIDQLVAEGKNPKGGVAWDTRSQWRSMKLDPSGTRFLDKFRWNRRPTFHQKSAGNRETR